MTNSTDPVKEFWSKVIKTDTCWLWPLKPNQKGYGQANIGGRKNLVVHRFVWMMIYGYIPDGLEVCHKCDVRHCVRPDHLFLGTHKENMADCVSKGRQVRGERSRHAKLTDAAVREIRQNYRRTSGRASNAKELSAKYGVGSTTITKAVNGSRWSHVK